MFDYLIIGFIVGVLVTLWAVLLLIDWTSPKRKQGPSIPHENGPTDLDRKIRHEVSRQLRNALGG